MTGQHSLHFCDHTFWVKYKGCIFLTTEKCDSNSFTICFLKVQCRIVVELGWKRSVRYYKQIMLRHFFYESLYVFITSILVVSKFWKILMMVEPSLLVCGKSRCLLDPLLHKHDFCWSPAYPGWQAAPAVCSKRSLEGCWMGAERDAVWWTCWAVPRLAMPSQAEGREEQCWLLPALAGEWVA